MRERSSNSLKALLKHRSNIIRRRKEDFERFISALIDEFSGKVSVVLFGSIAKGEGRPTSDFDVLLILDEIKGYWKVLERIYSLKGKSIPVDVVLVDVKALHEKDFLISEALGGKVLYDGLNVLKQRSSGAKTSSDSRCFFKPTIPRSCNSLNNDPDYKKIKGIGL